MELSGANIDGNCKLLNNQLINAFGKTVGFPANGGTLALISDIRVYDNANDENVNILQQEINYLATRLEATLQYFKTKLDAGNLNFNDIVDKVDAAVKSAK